MLSLGIRGRKVKEGRGEEAMRNFQYISLSRERGYVQSLVWSASVNDYYIWGVGVSEPQTKAICYNCKEGHEGDR